MPHNHDGILKPGLLKNAELSTAHYLSNNNHLKTNHCYEKNGIRVGLPYAMLSNPFVS